MKNSYSEIIDDTWPLIKMCLTGFHSYKNNFFLAVLITLWNVAGVLASVKTKIKKRFKNANANWSLGYKKHQKEKKK